jgi:hypothetical protein
MRQSAQEFFVAVEISPAIGLDRKTGGRKREVAKVHNLINNRPV